MSPSSTPLNKGVGHTSTGRTRSCLDDVPHRTTGLWKDLHNPWLTVRWCSHKQYLCLKGLEKPFFKPAIILLPSNPCLELGVGCIAGSMVLMGKTRK